MKKNTYFILGLILIVLIGGIFISIGSKRTEKGVEQITKECTLSCDDGDSCTQDLCSAETNFTCSNKPIVPCCGNNICEKNESFSRCPSDCTKPTPAEVALKSEDLPSGWEIIKRGEMTKLDVGEVALELGWVKGYQLTARKTDNKDIVISQTISIYPKRNITVVLTLTKGWVEEFKDGKVVKVDTYGNRYKLEELENLNLGDDSIIYSQTFLDTGEIIYRIEFIKDDIYVYSGGYDSELLKELARKAENKI